MLLLPQILDMTKQGEIAIDLQFPEKCKIVFQSGSLFAFAPLPLRAVASRVLVEVLRGNLRFIDSGCRFLDGLSCTFLSSHACSSFRIL